MEGSISTYQMVFYGILVAIPVLYFTSRTFKYYFKFLIFNLVFTVVGFISMWPMFLMGPKNVHTNMWLVSVMLTAVLKIFFVKVHVRNGDNLESDKPFILISNHQSSVDMIAFFQMIPSGCSALAKKELLYTGPFGIAAWLTGVVFVDRLNKEKARSTMEKTAQLLHDKNIKLWIFPEGTRNLDYGMLPFKKGAFHLAIQAQIPIVPVVFSSYNHFLDKKTKLFESGDVIATCLPPVPTKGLTGDDVNDLTERLRTTMLEVYEQTTEEVTGVPRSSRPAIK